MVKLLKCETQHFLIVLSSEMCGSFISMFLIALCSDTGNIFSLPFIGFHSNEVPCELIFIVYSFGDNSDSIFFYLMFFPHLGYVQILTFWTLSIVCFLFRNVLKAESNPRNVVLKQEPGQQMMSEKSIIILITIVTNFQVLFQ